MNAIVEGAGPGVDLALDCHWRYYLLADEDGVVVIPSAIVEDVIALAEAKSAVEDEVRADLRSGRSIAGTYEKLGVM